MTSVWQKWLNNFGIRDSWFYNPPGDGNCLFASIAEGLRPVLNITVNQLRWWASREVLKQDEEWFKLALITYREEVDRRQFEGAWSPYQCKTKEDLAVAILAPLHTKRAMDFQGDFFILLLLSKALRLDFIILEHQKGHGYTRVENPEEKNKYTLFLLFQNKGLYKHYQCLGVDAMERGVQSIFYSNDLPENFQRYLSEEEVRGKVRGKERELMKEEIKKTIDVKK